MASSGGRAIDLRNRLAEFQNSRVLVVGDTIVDLYTYGSALGLAAETPTIVARRDKVSRTLGGAAFVCRNLLELGAQVDFITVVGEDDEAQHVADFASPRLNLIAISDPNRPTTVKHRFWVDGYKLLQLDVREDCLVSEAVAAEVMSAFHAHLERANAVVISDYRHGLISPAMAAEFVAGANAAGKPAYVDSQVAQNTSNHVDYRSGAIVCLNLKEARCIDPAFMPLDQPAAFMGLQARLDARMLILKLGEQGSMIFDGEAVIKAPAWPVQAVDTTGAGDAFLASLVLTGVDDPFEALTLANAWAGLSIQIHGTIPPALDDLITMLAPAAADQIPGEVALPRAILFDLDDTILAAGHRLEVLRLIAGEFASELAPLRPDVVAERLDAALEAFWSDPARHKTARFGITEARQQVIADAFAATGSVHMTRDLAERFAARFAADRERLTDFFPGARETIETLKARGVRMALVTNGNSATQRAKIERFSLAPLFDHIQIEGEHAVGKPDERAYLQAMSALGVEAHETWIVGDNLEWEVAAPQKLGIFAIWHDGFGKGLPEESAVRPDRIIRAISELLKP